MWFEVRVGVVIGMTRLIPEVENFPQPPTPIHRTPKGGESHKPDERCFVFAVVIP